MKKNSISRIHKNDDERIVNISITEERKTKRNAVLILEKMFFYINLSKDKTTELYKILNLSDRWYFQKFQNLQKIGGNFYNL